MFAPRRIVIPFLLVLFLAVPVLGYNRPVDKVGPLSVRIEGPEEVAEIGVPQAVRVVIENSGDEKLQGTLRLGVIDRWRAEPSEAVSFAVPGGGKATYEFTVTAGEGTYRAHYPIHAFAKFAWQGQEHTVHPVLVLQTTFPQQPGAPRTIPWKPFRLPKSGQLALGRLPVHRAVVREFGEEPKTMPVGWQGSEANNGGSFGIRTETLDGVPRKTVAIHPPWRDGRIGTLFVEFPLVLPETKPLRLLFAHGMTPDGQSDGVTFRVRVAPLDATDGQLGEIIYERHTATKTWDPRATDLSRFAGQSVRLQLESHPGPANNTGWDQSYWAEPVLVVGPARVPLAFPPNDDRGSQLLGTAVCQSKQTEVRLWPGRRGLLDAVVGFRDGKERLYFHGFEVRVLGGRIDDLRSPILLQKVEDEPCDSGRQVRHHFQCTDGAFDLVGRLWVEQGVLRAKFQLENTPPDRPWRVVRLEELATGPWSHELAQVYAGHGNVVRKPEAYRLNFDGHRMATSMVGFDFAGGPSLLQGVDAPPTALHITPADRHFSLHTSGTATLSFIPAENVWEAVRTWHDTNGLEAAGGVAGAAGRFVFDLWGGNYQESADALRRSFRYGLTDSMVIWHNWQRWGYDYRLPEIYPPNPGFGTPKEMKDLIAACKEAEVPIALHDNYIDFYPDAKGFSYEEIVAFNAGGEPVKAWLNEGRDARSYRYRADRIEPFLRPNLQTIQKNLAPTAYFIDVWSSIRPYDYWTADGRFHEAAATRDIWGDHFVWIRQLQGNDAPQISESGHDQLIGRLDGAQTNHLRVGPPVGTGRQSWSVWDWKCADAERIPWFDAAHHDRFILHGAGYSSRYQAGLPGHLHGIYSDDYLSTEVLTGHPAMVPRPFNRDVVRKYWLTAELMRALALRRIESVEFVDGDLHRQHVRWSGGGQVWVNRGTSDWDVIDADGQSRTLPQYGFVAQVPTETGRVESSLTRRDGILVEAADSPRHVYVNGRQVVDGSLPIRLSVEKLQHADGRKFTLALKWQAEEPIPAGWTPFFHFLDSSADDDREIPFQAVHTPGTFATDRQGTFTASAHFYLPEGAEPGATWGLRAGIYHRDTGQRLRLSGPNDGEARIRLGTIRVKDADEMADRVAWTVHRPQPDLFLARWNPQNRPIDFGPVTTFGGCRLIREGEALVVTPLPGEHAAEFGVTIRRDQLPWQLTQPTHVEALDESGKVMHREPIRVENGRVLLKCAGDVFAYRLRRG